MAEQRTLTPDQAAAQLRGARRVAPGIWIDREGHAHISVPELLAHFGWPDTPENREMIAEVAEDWFAETYPEMTAIRQDLES
jgi:hypothetical protein